MKKINFFATLFIAVFALGVVNVSAKEIPVTDEATFRDALNSAVTGDTVILNNSITLSKKDNTPDVTGKEITIDGKDFTITGWRDEAGSLSSNQSIITAGANGIVHLKNVTLTNAQKYGVQAFNGGYVSLENVTINNCRYGGILLNAGTIEVISLNLGFNGQNPDGQGGILNNGIEVSTSVKLTDPNAIPSIIMNGTINSTEKDNVIYFASDANDNTTGFIVENTDTTTDKILVNGTTAVITYSNYEIKYESNELKEGTVFEGEDYTPNIEVTDPVEPETPTDEVKNEEVNPETSDGILLFLGLTIVGFAGVALTYRRLHN